MKMTKNSVHILAVLVLQLTWGCQGLNNNEKRLMTLTKMYQDLMQSACYTQYLLPCVKNYPTPKTRGQFCLILTERKHCLATMMNSPTCQLDDFEYETLRELACGSTEVKYSCLLMIATFVFAIFLVN